METLDDELVFFATAQGCVGKWNDRAVVDTPLTIGKQFFQTATFPDCLGTSTNPMKVIVLVRKLT